MDWSCAACGAKWPSTHGFCGFCGAARAQTGSASAEVDEVLRALVGDQLRAELVAAGGRLPEERRLVSAIFADLSGFTPLAGRLDPETLAEVVDPILAALVRIVKRHEGYVGSFAGDALLAYFGAPVAHEDDAVRAVRAAQEMLAEFPALLAVAPPQAAGLSLRIGVDTGAVMARLVAGDIKTDYNILGNSVNMAQRLQSNAPPGGCVVGETTYRLARDDFDFEDLGGLMVKGRSDPLPAFLVLGERARGVQRRAQRTARIVGREPELALLAQTEAAAGTLLLRAEAGGGKSRLLEEARARSTSAWHEGGCVPHDSATSYRAWRGVLEHVGDGDTAGVRIVRGHGDPQLAALPPARRRDLVARDVGATLAAAAPAVVVLEDLHWADQPTLDLLDDLLHDQPAGLTLFATSREPVATTAPLPALEVGGLVEASVATLIADLLGGDPPGALVEEVARRSGGNPLYVAELALALRDRGLVERVAGGALVATGDRIEQEALDLVPDSLEGLLGARIDSLPAAQERALTIAAVLGAPVEEELITAVAVRMALPHQEIPEAMAGLRAAHMIEDETFVHALVQNTAYVRTTRARRRTLHLAAADACADLVPAHARSGFLARNLYLAGAGPRAVEALEVAAGDALSQGRHEEAVLHLTRDVELRAPGGSSTPAQQARRTARLVELGGLLERLGRYTEAVAALREAIACATTEAEAETALHVLVTCLRCLGEYDDALALASSVTSGAAWVGIEQGWAYAARGDLDHALDALSPRADGVDGALQDLVRGYCATLQGDFALAERMLRAAAEVLEPVGAATASARTRRLLGQAVARQGRLTEAREILVAGLAMARRAGSGEEEAACLNNLVLVDSATGDDRAALGWAQQAVRAADRMRHSYGRAVTRNNLADTYTDLGEPERAIGIADEAIALAQAGDLTNLEGLALHTRGRARFELGDAPAALADLEAALGRVAGTDHEAEVRDLLHRITSTPTATAPPIEAG